MRPSISYPATMASITARPADPLRSAAASTVAMLSLGCPPRLGPQYASFRSRARISAPLASAATGAEVRTLEPRMVHSGFPPSSSARRTTARKFSSSRNAAADRIQQQQLGMPHGRLAQPVEIEVQHPIRELLDERHGRQLIRSALSAAHELASRSRISACMNSLCKASQALASLGR